jgi:opacity protein-like surface antigen
VIKKVRGRRNWVRKRAILYAAFLLSLWMPAHAVEFHLKLGGGLTWFRPIDVNRAVRDWVEWHERESAHNDDWTYLGGNTPEIRLGYNFEGELQFFLIPRLAFSVGAGFLYTDLSAKETEIRIDKKQGVTQLVQPRTLSAIPLIFSLYTHIPLNERFRVYAKAGAGMAWAKHIEREGSKREAADKFNYSQEENASAKNPVYQAGLGLDFALESGVRFFLEGSYRWLRVTSFSGETGEGETGTLYHFEELSPDLGFWQAKNRLFTEPPVGENIRSVRETEVDFSGFSLILGVAIRF